MEVGPQGKGKGAQFFHADYVSHVILSENNESFNEYRYIKNIFIKVIHCSFNAYTRYMTLESEKLKLIVGARDYMEWQQKKKMGQCCH